MAKKALLCSQRSRKNGSSPEDDRKTCLKRQQTAAATKVQVLVSETWKSGENDDKEQEKSSERRGLCVSAVFVLHTTP